MKKFFDWFIGAFVCMGIVCYCIIGEFVLLFKDE